MEIITSALTLQRMTALARATDDIILRADCYRLAESYREHLRTMLPRDYCVSCHEGDIRISAEAPPLSVN